MSITVLLLIKDQLVSLDYLPYGFLGFLLVGVFPLLVYAAASKLVSEASPAANNG